MTITTHGPVEPLLRTLVGAILRAHREEQGRTLRDVAQSARVSVAYLSEVERARKEPSSEVLIAVCRALGLRLVDLVGAAHAELARAEGRIVVDLTAPRAADLVATSTEHGLATVTQLTGRTSSVAPVAENGTAIALGTSTATVTSVGAVLLAA